MSAAAPPLAASSSPAPSRSLIEALLPSFTDIVFIAVIVWTFMAGDLGWSSLLTDGDSGWHIRTGQHILSTRSVPHADLFSFSKAGEPWFAWEWLTDVLYAVLFGWFGLKGIVLVSGLIISLTATLVCRHMVWRGASPIVALPLSLLTLGAASIHFHARPHVFTMLFLAVAAWLLDADRRRSGRAVWWLVPLMALWTNLHGGFPILVAMIALLAVGCAARALFGCESWAAAQRYAWLGAACGAATLINPYGWQLHAHIFAYLRSDWIQSAVQEFQAPNFRGEGMLHYELLLVAGLLTAAQLMRRAEFPAALWLLFLAHESLHAARHVPLFAIVAAPLIASELSALWGSFAASQSKQALSRVFWNLGEDIAPQFRRTSVWSGVWVLALFMIGAPSIKWPSDYPALRFPVKMAERYAPVLRESRLLTTDQWGDYLLYRDYPRQKVFLDGRSDFYGPVLGKEYLSVSQAQHDWRAILARHRFDAVLAPTDWALATVLKEQPDWQLLADDHQALLFVRRDRAAALLAGLPEQGREIALRH